MEPGPAQYRLPSGRHGLPREFIVSNQRERILDGVTRAVSEQGYAAMRIEDVIAHAGVSRRTFYDHFSNKEEGFLAAYDLILAQLHDGVAAAHAIEGAWPSRVRRALSAFLTMLSREPVLAHVCVVEVLTAGPRALERRARALEDFQVYLRPPDDEPLARRVAAVTAEAIVGGISEVVYSRVVVGRTDELPDLLGDLLYGALLPYAGHELAAAEAQSAMARRAASPR